MAELDDVNAALDEVTTLLSDIKAKQDAPDVESALLATVQSRLDDAKQTLDHIVAAAGLRTASVDKLQATTDGMKETLRRLGFRLFGTTVIYLSFFTLIIASVFALATWFLTTNSVTKAASAATKADRANFNASVALINHEVLRLEVSDSFSSEQAEDIITRIQALFNENEDTELRRTLEFAATTAIANFGQVPRFDLVERLYTAVGPLLADNEPMWASIFAILGVRGVLAGPHWEEADLYDEYKDRTLSFPELHILYDALIAQAQQLPAADFLKLTRNLDSADSDNFVSHLSSLLSGEAGLPADQSSHLKRIICDLLQADENRDIDLLESVRTRYAPNHCIG